jgi:hypothetical protein
MLVQELLSFHVVMSPRTKIRHDRSASHEVFLGPGKKHADYHVLSSFGAGMMITRPTPSVAALLVFVATLAHQSESTTASRRSTLRLHVHLPTLTRAQPQYCRARSILLFYHTITVITPPPVSHAARYHNSPHHKTTHAISRLGRSWTSPAIRLGRIKGRSWQ